MNLNDNESLEAMFCYKNNIISDDQSVSSVQSQLKINEGSDIWLNSNESVSNSSKNSSTSIVLSSPFHVNNNGLTNDDPTTDPDAEKSLLLEDNTFSCSDCSFTTDRKRVLTDHKRNHRRSNNPVFQCFYCSQRYTRFMLYNHVQNVHPGQKFQIRDEGLTDVGKPLATDEADELRLQAKSNASMLCETEEEVEKSFLSCSQCSFTTDDKIELKLHEKEHKFELVRSKNASGYTIYNCKICSYGCASSDRLMKHMKIHKTNTPLRKCPNCDFRSTDWVLRFHLRKCGKDADNEGCETQNDDTNNRYSESDSSTKQDTLEDEHMKSETDNSESLVCTICNFPADNQDILIEHLSQHDFAPIKRASGGFDCRYCSYSCLCMTNMNRHMKVHRQNLAILKCPKCDFKSSERALYCHVGKCRGGMTIGEDEPSENGSPLRKCPNCDYCSTARGLQSHLKVCGKGFDSDEKEGGNDDTDTRYSESEASYASTKGRKGVDVKSLICSICHFSADNQDNLKEHISEHDLAPIKRFLEGPGRQMYHCGVCSYSCSSIFNINSHMNVHRQNSPIHECPRCDFKSTGKALAFHLDKCNGETKINPIKVEPRENFSNEQSDTVEISPVYVKRTRKRYQRTETKLQLLLNKHLFYKENGALKYSCKKCSYQSSKLDTIKRHAKRHKNNKLTLKCPYCDFRSTRHALMFHVKLKHSDVQIKNEEPAAVEETTANEPVVTYLCFTCSFSTTEKDQLTWHIQEHFKKPLEVTDSLGRLQNQCQMCSFRCQRVDDMSVHLKAHEFNLPIEKCPHCDYKSTPKALMIHEENCQHNLQNNDESPLTKPKSLFRCTRCKFMTCQRLKLNSHIKKCHSKIEKAKKKSEKPVGIFKCNQCSFVAPRKFNLARHVVGHQRNSSMMSCSNCNYVSTVSAVKKHKQTCGNDTATESKLYVCDRCEYSSNNLHSYCAHLKKHRRRCGVCSCLVGNTAELEIHMRSHMVKLRVKKCPHCDFRSTSNILSNHVCVRYSEEASTSEENTRSSDNSDFQCTKSSVSSELKIDVNEHVNNRATDDQPDLIRHKKRKMMPFKCHQCSFTSLQRRKIVNHEQTHLKNLPIRQCDNCEFKSTPKALKFHSNRCKKSQVLKSNSKSRTPEVSNNETSNSDLSTKQRFQCEQCSFSTKIRIKLTVHVNKYHKELIRQHSGSDRSENQKIAKKNIVKCNQCSFEARDHRKIIRHNRTHLKNQAITQCSNCEYKSTSRALKFHYKKCKIQARKPESKAKKVRIPLLVRKLAPGSVRKFKCPFCPLNASLSQNLKIHLEKFHQDKLPKQNTYEVFSCSKCGFSSLYRLKLVKHLVAYKHGSILVNKGFPKEASGMGERSDLLKKPSRDTKINQKTSPKIYQCEYCSFTSFWQYVIEKHMPAHTLMKLPIEKCGNCEFRSTPATLRAHRNCCKGDSDKMSPQIKNQLSKTRQKPKSEEKLKVESDDQDVGLKIKQEHSGPADSQENESRSKGLNENSSSFVKNEDSPNQVLKNNFQCPKCSFSTHLRIKLNVHVQKCH